MKVLLCKGRVSPPGELLPTQKHSLFIIQNAPPARLHNVIVTVLQYLYLVNNQYMILRYTAALFLFCLCLKNMQAQGSKLDSLVKAERDYTKEDTNKVKLLNNIA